MPADPGTGRTPGSLRKPRQPRKRLPLVDPVGAAHVPHAAGTGAHPAHQALPEWVVRRQRLLRAKGYPVAVDGVWGSQSQHYWNVYLHRATKRPGSPPAPIVKRPPRGPQPLQRHNLITQRAIENARLARRRAAAQARLQRLRQEALDLGPAAQDAHRHGENILAGARRDGQGGLRPTELARQHALAFRPKIIRAEADVARTKPPEQMTAHELLLTTVDPATSKFDPQNPRTVRTIQRWLRQHGNPGLLVDGVYGKRTDHALRSTFDRLATREHEKQVSAVKQRYYDSGVINRLARDGRFPLPHVPKPGELLAMLQQRSFTGAAVYRALEAARLQDVNLGLDHRFASWRDEFLQRTAANVRGPFHSDLIPFSRAELAVIDPTTLDVLNQDSFEGVRKVLLHAQAEQEKRYRDNAMQRSNGRGFWGTIGAGLAWTGHEGAVLTTAVGDVLVGSEGAPDGRRRAVDDVSEAVQRAQIQVSEAERDHPIATALIEMVLDPLNAIPGKFFLAPVVGVGRGAAGLERVGFRLATSTGRIRNVPLGLALQAPAFGGRAFRAAVEQTAARTTARLAFEASRHPGNRTLLLRPITTAYVGARHATMLKRDVEQAIYRTTRNLRRRNFELATVKGAENAARLAHQAFEDGRGLIDAPMQKRLADVERAQRNALSSVFGGRLDRQLRRWASQGVSLYANVDSYVPSIAGHNLLASWKERVRVETAKDIARRDASVEAARVVGGTNGPAFEAKVEELYQRNLERFGVHYRGGVDPIYDAALEHATAYEYRRLEDAILPTMQRRLVELAQQAGVELWDEEGAWLGRLEVAADASGLVGRTAASGILEQMRADARANFEFFKQQLDGIPNPLYRKFFSRADAERMMESEIERRVAALEFAAEVADFAGKPWPKGQLEELTEKIEREVHDAWDEVPRGVGKPAMWTDTRRTVTAPRVYTRHLTADAVLDPAEVLFAEDPKLVEMLPMLVSREGRAPAADADDFVRDLDVYRRTVTLHHDALDEATSMAKTALMRRNGLLLAALRRRQAGPVRTIYRTFEGATAQWKFLTLPLRAAWTVRNVADNTLKVLLQGVVDPRAWFSGAETPGSATRSIFEYDIATMRHAVSFIESAAGLDGRATAAFDAAIEQVMGVNERVLSAVFGAHGVPVPEALIREARFEREHGGMLARWQDRVWELMGNRPEAYFKRVLYRDTYRKALADGHDELAAGKLAWKKVEATLFDYSNVTVLEDNLALLAPFIQFWRKNTVFWLKTFAQKPWFLADIAIYQDALEQAHENDPEWLRRYIPLREVTDAVAKIPGLEFFVEHALGNPQAIKRVLEDTAYDPLNFFSFSPLYRTFKGENPLLPVDKAGWKFIAPMIDAMNDWGLGLNPFFRKPLEFAGVLNFRAWQSIFPQTQLAQAFTREYARGLFGDQGFNLEAFLLDPVLERLDMPTIAQMTERSFNQYVQQEMTGQLARGEQPSRARAETKIRQFLYIQTLIGYFAGAYLRRMTPEDLYLQQLSDAVNREQRDWNTLTTREKELYKAWSLRKADPVRYENYVDALPTIRAYYELHDFDAREQWKQEHPQIIPFVERAFGERLPDASFVTTQMLVNDTQLAIEQSDFARAAGIDFQTRTAAESLYVTPELRDFWAKNDMPRQIRDRMLRGAWARHVQRLNDTFYAIPATDYEAKQRFLDDNPVLWDSWQQDNTAADDLSSIQHSSNAALRELYFELIDRADHAAAADFLHRFPFIFEDTSAADRVDERTGEWVYGANGKRHFTGQKARDYLEAKAGLDYLFESLSSWGQRNKWIVGSDPRAAAARAFLAKYDGWIWRNGRFAPASFWTGQHRHGMTQHARDYLAVKDVLSWWFNLLKADKDAAQRWLDGDTDGAKKLRAYFRKWGNKRGMTEHAKAYLDAKKQLDHYFSLSKDERRRWLDAGSPDAQIVLAYFKKWGHQARYATAWNKGGFARTANPELARRLEFWRTYWNLRPQDRPAYVQREAADHGVFVYGVLGDKERHDSEQRWLRQALLHGVKDKKAALYLRAKPLLDIYFTLAPDDQALFARANPEVQEYLDAYSDGPSTGDKKLDALVETYFKLPEGSQARSDFLHAHPDVQRYFDEKSTPAERATRNLLNLYFSLDPRDRRQFSLEHPEIQAYFDKKQLEHQNATASAAAFDSADPRLRELLDLAERDIVQPAEQLRDSMHRHSREKPDSLGRRRDRTPLDQRT